MKTALGVALILVLAIPKFPIMRDEEQSEAKE